MLNDTFNARLKDRDSRIEQVTKEATEWRDRYLDLVARLADATVKGTLQQRAEEMLKAGRLDEAGKILDQVIADEEKETDQLARNHFNRASLYELQLQPLQALPHYEKAFNYRRNNAGYGQSYANLLSRQREFAKAEVIYKEVLEIRRGLAKLNPRANAAIIAETLNSLGILYRITGRLRQATDAFKEALKECDELELLNVDLFMRFRAGLLDNLGLVYHDTQRPEEAELAYTEALDFRRVLAKANPEVNLPGVALVLNNLGLLYATPEGSRRLSLPTRRRSRYGAGPRGRTAQLIFRKWRGC